jgi:cysteine desulfurase
MIKKTSTKKIYLDYASSTPLDERVLKVLINVSKNVFANPSALHGLGVEAHLLLENSRKKVADALGAHADEIIFVSGGTESDNLALMGTIRAFKKTYPNIRPHVIISAIEHAAVLSTSEWLSENSVDGSVLPVDQNGIADSKALRKLIRPETVLVSVMYANNEIGTIEPIAEIAKEVRHAKRHKPTDSLIDSKYPLFHTDASQALNYLEANVVTLGVDLLTLNSSKLYGPKGIGALYVKRRAPIAPILFGGDQEQGLRPGTEALPLIAAFAEAVVVGEALRPKESVRLAALRDYAFEKLHALPFPVRINGDVVNRLPNNINITIPRYNGEMLVLYLDAQGICVSAKSACKSTDPEASHVIRALGYDSLSESEAGSIRISMGRQTTKKDIDAFLKALVHVVSVLVIS